MATLSHAPALKHQLVPSLGGMQASARVSDYILEQRTQKAYRRLLRTAAPDNEAWDNILEQSFPKHFARTHRDRCQVYWQAEQRVEHLVPELIARLGRPDLERVAALVDAGALVSCIRFVWDELRVVMRRIEALGKPKPPKPRSVPKPRKTPPAPLGPPLVLTPPPVQRAPHPRPAVCRVGARPRLRVQGGRQLSLWPPVERPFPGVEVVG